MSYVSAPQTVLPPHLVESRGGVNLCSACLQAFDADSKPSISVAFKNHVLDVHRPKEDAAARSLKQIKPVEDVG
jgi:hypothetical protein